MNRLYIIVAALILTGTHVGAFDFVSSRGDGMGQTVQLSHSLPSELLRVPGGGIQNGEWRVESGYSRQYDMSELDQFYVAAAYRYRWLTVVIGGSSFGESDLFTEKTGVLGLAYHRDSLTFGLKLSGSLVQFGAGYGDLSAVTFGVGASYRLSDFIFAATSDNLTSPKYYEFAVETKPVHTLFAEFRGKRSFSVNARATMEQDQDVQLALGQSILLSERASIFWGISTEPLKYGTGLELGLAGSKLTYAFSNHPVLGFTHTISVSYGTDHSPTRKSDDFK